MTKTSLNADQHSLKLIIDASCTADFRTKSRWGQALRYVWQRRKHRIKSREQFDRFVNGNGGIAGCAAKVAVERRLPNDGSRLGFGFDALAHQKMIDADQSSAVSAGD